MMHSGNIYSIQRFSVHDGPGIRTTVFFKGCPLHCAWCHNPESQTATPELLILEERCLGCWACSQECPQADAWQDELADGSAAKTSSQAGLVPGTCDVCGACALVCPTEARQVVGSSLDVDELIAEAQRDRPFFAKSNGGVTFSGGEPLLQPEFLLACLRAAHEVGLHTAVDTCGYAPEDLFRGVVRTSDLILFDLKFIDDPMHRKYTGVPAQPIKDNLCVASAARAASTENAAIWVRIPLIPGINDDTETLVALADFVRELPAVEQVHLLPYHQVGTQKYERLGKHGPAVQPDPPTDQAVVVAGQIFIDRGLDIRTGG